MNRAAIASLAVLLAGCTAPPAHPPPTTAPITTGAPAGRAGAGAGPRGPDKTDAYLTVVRAVLLDLPRARVIAAGHLVCGALDTAPDLAHYAEAISSVAAGQRDRVFAAKTLVDAAIEAFCPAHLDLAARFEAAQHRATSKPAPS